MTTTRKLWPSLVAAAAVAVAMLVPSGAGAHTMGFYKWWYPTGLDDVPVYFDSGFPTGRYRDRVADGARQWNDVGRRMYYLVHRTPSIDSSADQPDLQHYQTTCPTPQRDGRRVGMMHWAAIDGQGGILGITGWCWKKGDVGGKEIHSFRIHLDRAESWYSGSGDSSVRDRTTGRIENRMDLWSVVTHELGHATGWLGHWKESGSYCSLSGPAADFRTMCPVYAPGLERQRTLSGADKHVFRSAYAAR
jgi:hypothetical protein